MTALEFETAVERYADMIFRLAYSYLKSRADAEDVMQETLLKLYTEQGDFDSPAHERNWMARVAVNEDIDITDEIAETGAYHQEWIMERRAVTVDVTGTQADWTLVEEVTDREGNIYRTTVTSGDMAAGVQTKKTAEQ